MATNKHLTLFKRLYRNTENSDLKWKETLENDRFMASFTDYSVFIMPEIRPNGTKDYVIEISNSSGDVVDSFNDVELGLLLDHLEERDLLFKEFEELYELARRSARGADVALNSILKELDEGHIPF